MTDNVPDMTDTTWQPVPDMKMGTMGGEIACGGIIQCMNMCGDQKCYDSCLKMGTKKAQSLLLSLFQCIEKACPSKNTGDVCNMQTQACNDCYSKAQMMNGACYATLSACNNDM